MKRLLLRTYSHNNNNIKHKEHNQSFNYDVYLYCEHQIPLDEHSTKVAIRITEQRSNTSFQIV